jgi:hypothetical protein
MALDLTKIPMLQRDDNGPFTDDFVRRIVDVRNTQHGIIKYMEAMAQVMAEAAVASQKAVGDSPSYAIDKWTDVVRERAKELLAEKNATKKLDKGTVVEGEK